MTSQNRIVVGDLSSDDDTQDEEGYRASLGKQKLSQRCVIFWTCFIICILLYLLFALSLVFAVIDPILWIAIIEHKHLVALLGALLVVPSALLWGMVRAAYTPEKESIEIEEVAKTIKGIQGIHPTI